MLCQGIKDRKQSGDNLWQILHQILQDVGRFKFIARSWELLTKVYGLDPARLHVMTRWEALMIFWDSLVIFRWGFRDGGFGVRDEWFYFFGVQG